MKFLPGRGSKAKKTRLLTAQETWRVEKAPLGHVIWDHKYQVYFIKFPSKVPVDIGWGDLNPRLSFLLFPFGLFEDSSSSMTLQLKLHIPDHCPPLPLTDTFNLSWAIYTQGEGASTTGERLTHSKKPLKIPFGQGMLYIFKFLPHDKIKRCDCQTFEISMQTSYLLQNTSSAKVQDTESGITSGQTGMHAP